MAIFTHCRIIRGTWRHMVKPICTLKTKFYIVLMAITFILVLVFKISYDNNSNGNKDMLYGLVLAQPEELFRYVILQRINTF